MADKPVEPEFIEVWEACEHVDKEDGLEGVQPIGYYRSEFLARDAAKDTGVQGTRGPVRKVVLLSLDGGDTGYLIDPNGKISVHQETDDDVRRLILQKLDPEEVEFLGVRKDKQ